MGDGLAGWGRAGGGREGKGSWARTEVAVDLAYGDAARRGEARHRRGRREGGWLPFLGLGPWGLAFPIRNRIQIRASKKIVAERDGVGGEGRRGEARRAAERRGGGWWLFD
jgi:hypothetical protein